MDRDERVTRVAALLHGAGEAHHAVYRIVDAADDGWAIWYSEWLTTLPELPAMTPVRSATPWPEVYARAIVAEFTST